MSSVCRPKQYQPCRFSPPPPNDSEEANKWLFYNLCPDAMRIWSPDDFQVFSRFAELGIDENNKENLTPDRLETEPDEKYSTDFRKPLSESNTPTENRPSAFLMRKQKPSAEQLIKVKVLSSYNWSLEQWTPTIVVPGAPKLFYPWPGGQLERTNEVMVVDEDTFRLPQAPLDPILASVCLAHPDYKLNSVDIVADLSSIKRLTRFVLAAIKEVSSDHNTKSVLNNFRIDLELVNKVLLMVRREQSHSTVWAGYGAAYIKTCVHDSIDPLIRGPHKRITELQLGGLKLLLRHKVLAADYPSSAYQEPVSKRVTSSRRLGKVQLIEHHVSDTPPEEYSMIELGSLYEARQLSADKYVDMVLTGCDRLYLGRHRNGWFPDPSFVDREQVRKMCGVKDSDRVFLVLESLLCQILSTTRSRSQATKFSLIGKTPEARNEKASLKLYEWRDPNKSCRSVSKEFLISMQQ